MSIKRVTNWRNQPQMDDINRLITAVEDLIESGAQGEQGEAGDDGDNGWTPVFGLEAREDDVVMVITDFVAGQGTKPVSLIGLYVAQDGLSSDILDAVNVRGMQGLRGEAGLDGENGEGVPMGGDTGQVLAKRSSDSFDTEWVHLPPSGGDNGVESFLELSDTPSDYTGQAGKLVAVNPLEDALEFIDAPSGGGGNGGGEGGGYGEWIRFTDSPIVSPDVTTRSEWNWYRVEDGYCVYNFGFEMRMATAGNGQITLVAPLPTFTGDNTRRLYEFQHTLSLRQGNNHWTPFTHECALETFTNQFFLRSGTGQVLEVGSDWVRCRGSLRYKLTEG